MTKRARGPSRGARADEGDGLLIADMCVNEAGKKGKGVFALRDFAPGELIFRTRRGPLVKRHEIAALSEEDQRHLDEIDRDTYQILPPPACYLNHSCDPNAIGKGLSLYAWKPIKKGEEITTDYRIAGNPTTTDRWPCSCGSSNCRGFVVRNFFTLSEEAQRRYLPYAPKFIREEYKRRHARGREGR